MKKYYNDLSIDSQTFKKQIQKEKNKHSTEQKRNVTRNQVKIRQPYVDKILSDYFVNEIKNVICIGCRDDTELKMFEKNNIETIGIDVANETKKIIRSSAENINNLFKENQFDLAFSSHSLEHVAIPDLVMKNIRNIAKIGCYIILPREEITSSPSPKHPVIYDISLCKENDKKIDLIKSLEKDFKIFQPYEIKDIFYNKEMNEFHICFKWLD